MTTTALVRTVVKPLLARNSDLALVERLVVVKPVRHLLRGVYIDRTSAVSEFHPVWAIVFLFEPEVIFSFNWGGRFQSREYWNVDDLTTQSDLCEAIEREALPKLRPVETLDDFMAYLDNPRFTKLEDHPWRAAIVYAARGDFQAALAACARIEKGASYYARYLTDEYNYIMRDLRPLVEREDRVSLARLLHEWEAASVRNLKLEQYWEPSPFPLEGG